MSGACNSLGSGWQAMPQITWGSMLRVDIHELLEGVLEVAGLSCWSA